MKLATAALICAAVAGCDNNKTDDEPNYGSNRSVASLEEAAPANIVMIPHNTESQFTLTVKLDKPVERDVRFNIFPTNELIDDYNLLQGSDYRSLPAENYRLNSNIALPQGETVCSTTLVLPNGLPDDDNNYALGVRLSAGYIDYTSINPEKSSVLYVFYREGEEAPDPTLPPTVSLTGSNQPTLVDEEHTATVQFTVTLSKTYEQEVTVNLALDTEGENVLTEEYITWNEKSVTFTAGELQKTVSLTVNSLPDYDPAEHDYEQGPDQTLKIVLDSAAPEEVTLSSTLNSASYTFTYPVPKRPFEKTEAVQTSVKFKSTVANTFSAQATLGLTLNQWTIEAWIKYYDNSSLTVSSWIGSDTNAKNKRKRVYPPENKPFLLPINFCFYPLGNSGHAPNMTIGSWVSMPYGEKTQDGFCWSPDEWTHLAFVFDGENLRFYINGEAGEYADSAQDNANSTKPVSQGYEQDYIQSLETISDWTTLQLASPGGNGASTASYYRMGMAQLRLWSVARTQEEIDADKAYNIDPQSEGLEGYWPMDETSGTTLRDITANGRNITATASYIEFPSDQVTFSTQGTRKKGQAYN